MSTTSKRNLYVSVLGVCAFGLLIDRTLLSPGGAEASETTEAHAASIESVTVDVEATIVASDAPSGVSIVANQLLAIAEQHPFDPATLPDAFEAPASWLPEDGVPVYDEEGVEQKIERFVESHRLTAVLAGGAAGQAIVDGGGVRMGASLDGFTLVEVGSDFAVFELGSRTVRLAIER